MWHRQVQEQGFAILADVFTPWEVDQFTREFELATPFHRRSRAGVRHALSLPTVTVLAQDVRLVKLASDILRGDAFPFRAALFDKSPSANWLVVWHQDTALPLRKREDLPGWGPWSVKGGVVYAHAPEAALKNVVALRVHLDDSHETNGPLRVLPGTHRGGVLSDDEIEQLAREAMPFEFLVPKGGILAMSPLLVHCSSKAQGEARRRVLHIEYAVSKISAEGLELAVA